MTEPDGQIIYFYLNEGKDHRGRTLQQVWRFDFAELEISHDFIQWLFPTSERSQFNPEAPVVTAQEIALFKENALLRQNLVESLKCMLAFYGLVLDESVGHCVITKTPFYSIQKKNWLTPLNHNFLRITRILTSLSVLGCRRHAEALLAALELIYEEDGRLIGQRTMNFWRHALNAQ